MKPPEFPQMIKMRTGLVAEVRTECDLVIFTDIFGTCEYDRAMKRALFVSEARSPLIIDVGMNIGYFTLCALDHARRADRAPLRIIGFEAINELADDCEGRLDKAGLTEEERGFIMVVRGMVGSRHGFDEMELSPSHPCHRRSVLSTGKYKQQVSGYRDIDFVDMEKYIPELCAIDLIKCDIEGSEELFLENYQALLKRTRNLVIELHPFCDVPRCRRLIAEAGFHEPELIRAEAGGNSTELFSK